MEVVNEVNESEGELQNYDSHGVTSCPISHYRFKWTLKDYSRLRRPIVSSVFKLPTACNFVDISIKLASYTSAQKFQYISFENCTNYLSSSCIKWTAFVCDGNGKLLFKSLNNVDYSSEIRSSLFSNVSLSTDTMIIIFDYSIYSDVKSEICNLQRPFDYTAQEKLILDLKTMYETQQLTDVTLRVDDDYLLAHKSILSVRSPVFQKMFQNETSERDQNIVQVEDVKKATLKKFLHFLYTGAVEAEEDIESTYSLYYASDKYEVLDLRKMCADTMLSKLTPENAFQLAIWADRHQDEFFKKSVLDFICINFNSIVDTDAWEQIVLSEERLAAQMMKHCIKKRMN